MRTHDNIPERADVVAGFDSQDDADEALLELRLAGFRDDHMGYYSSSRTAATADLMERNYWIAGATLGALAGVALGVWLAGAIPGWESPYARGLDLLGLMITCVTFGSLFLGTIGGLIGLGIPRRAVAAPGGTDDPLVLAVSAGTGRDAAWSIIRRHGGHELHSDQVALP